MSNDSKFWVARLVFFACVLLDFYLLLLAIGGAMSGSDNMTKRFIRFFVVLVITLPSMIFYYVRKSQRWDQSRYKTQDQVDVETLAALGAEQQKHK